MTAPGPALYVGRVAHRRFRPRAHRLSYRVFWLLIDIDGIDATGRRLRLFSRDRWNLFSFRAKDYGDRSGAPLRLHVAAALAAAGIAREGGRTLLLTMPRILGYAFNPLSVYFCYRSDGTLAATIHEVHNTFGEIHSYVMAAGEGEAPLRHESAKVFHVSPFLDRDMTYRFNTRPPGETVSVGVSAVGPEGPMLAAMLEGARRPLDDRQLARVFLSHPLLTLKVTFAIHWHALRLVLKRIAIVRYAPPPEAAVTAGRLSGGGEAPGAMPSRVESSGA